ncbi:hypothetical protein ACFX11_028411 [Malus domestica]
MRTTDCSKLSQRSGEICYVASDYANYEALEKWSGNWLFVIDETWVFAPPPSFHVFAFLGALFDRVCFPIGFLGFVGVDFVLFAGCWCNGFLHHRGFDWLVRWAVGDGGVGDFQRRRGPYGCHCASLSNSFGFSNRTLRLRSLLGRFASGEACSSGSILKEQASALVLPITRFINSCAAEQIRLQPFWRMLCSMTIIEKLITQRNLLLVVLDKWDKRNGCCPVFYFVGWQEACSVIVPADIWTKPLVFNFGG